MRRALHRAILQIGACARRFAAGADGSITIMAALFAMIAVLCAALAVDVASLYAERRLAQGAVDLAAIAAAKDLERAEAAARATLTANGLDGATGLLVERGTYKPDPSLPYAGRFTPSEKAINAARVKLTKPGRLYFGKVLSIPNPVISVEGMAFSDAIAQFSIGSRLAAVREGLINALLRGLFGSGVSLSAVDYDALLDADLKLFPLMKALATELDVTAGTYDNVLSSSAKMGDLLGAMANVADAGGDPYAKAALSTLKSQTGAGVALPLSKLISLGPLGKLDIGSPDPGLDATLNAMGLISAAGALANGSNQVNTALQAGIPGLLGLTLNLAIGEPQQWSAVGGPGTMVGTAQVRLRLVATVAGTGALAGVGIRLPIYIQIAQAEARLDDVSCVAEGFETVQISARPGVAEAWIGEISGELKAKASPTVSPAKVVDLAFTKVRGSAHVAAANTSWSPLTFTKEDIKSGVIKTVNTSNLAQSLVTSLLGNLQLEVQVLGLGLGVPSGLTGLVGSTLGSVAAPLDAVVHQLITALGVSIGEADVRVHGMMCGNSRLAG